MITVHSYSIRLWKSMKWQMTFGSLCLEHTQVGKCRKCDAFRSQDVLAKHCGALLDHFDLLMPYAELGHLKPVESGWLWMGPSELHFDIGQATLDTKIHVHLGEKHSTS